ncbi:homeobox protein Mohawk-like isoform X2 [Myxocyprinus asiaticus]|uniref:homeobox protein Mohawk-like isoform X2 n=1 Tax=Myxocyprinus asiaticus TaxID=70543 RepID=UPI0022219031|nr:homeobox protein Mohawk-like isoform X2 [Myxocyprinus asiaticus]
MNTVVFSKFDHRRFDESGKSVERTGRNYLEVIDGQHRDLLSSHKVMDGTGALKHRRNGGGKVRHKRQTLQDMARPLKQWLYKHRDNPYPTKTEKILLALGSHMTLVQVSNWFANARRRLKNTVRQPDLSWALRIKLYNKYVQGNAERLSISSNDTASDDGENTLQMQASVSNFNRPTHKSVIQDGRGKVVGRSTDPSVCDDYVSPPKYKNSLLNRYLNDSLQHVMASEKVLDSRKRNHSGSFSSNEYEDDLLSPSSSEAEANFTYHTVTLDCGTHPGESAHKGGRRGNGETYWKELHAAMALTNLAHGKESAAPGTTSCIIQKSSHIAEIKTVKVPTQPRH